MAYSEFLISSLESIIAEKLDALLQRRKMAFFEVDDRRFTMDDTVMEKKVVNGTKDVYLWGYGAEESLKNQMNSGNTLFQLYSLRMLNQLRDSTVDFGILPLPKNDETQKEYINNDWSSIMGVPSTIQNPEMVSKVIEYMSYISGDTTIPAYYDVMLGNKLSRDEDSRKMMDIIFDSIVFDAGVNYFGFGTNMMPLFYSLENVVRINKNDNFVSLYEKYATAAQTEIDQFMEKVDKLEK